MSNTDPLVRTLLLIIAVVLLVPFLAMLVAWPMMGMWGGGHMWDANGPAGFGFLALLLWLLPLVLIAGVGYLLYRAMVNTEQTGDDRALEELRIAYARGDISDEEFETRRSRLQRDE